MECKLIQTIEFPTNTLFIGEILGAYAGEECLTEGRPNIKKMDPLLLTMPDNRYWKVGDYAGKAGSLARIIRKEGKLQDREKHFSPLLLL